MYVFKHVPRSHRGDWSSSHGTVKGMFKNNLELRVSLRQTYIRVQYLPPRHVYFEFLKKSTVADLTHLSLRKSSSFGASLTIRLKFRLKFQAFGLKSFVMVF